MSVKTPFPGSSECRACLRAISTTKDAIYLFNRDENCAEYETIADLFFKCTLLKIVKDKGLTVFLCTKCYKKLTEFYKFREMCVVSYFELKKRSDLKGSKREGGRSSILVDLIKKGRVNSTDVSIVELEEVEVKLEDPLRIDSSEMTTEDDLQQIEMPVSTTVNEILEVNVEMGTKIKEEFDHDDDANLNNSTEFDCYGKIDSDVDTDKATANIPRIDHMAMKLKMQRSPENLPRVKTTRQVQLKCECKQCHQVFTSLSDLKSHLQLHNKTQNSINPKKTEYRCVFCPNVTPFASALIDHIRCEHFLEKRAKKFICILCKRIMIDPRKVNEHKREHSVNLSKEDKKKISKHKYYECEQCPSSFQQSRLLERHLETHENTQNLSKMNKIEYRCELCSMVNLTAADLIHHRRDNHFVKKLGREFSCILCNKVMKEAYEINYHKQVHLENLSKEDRDKIKEQEMYQCEFCPKLFLNRMIFERHSVTHTKNLLANVEENDNQAMCEICLKTYVMDCLPAHRKRSHHVRKLNNEFICLLCDEIMQEPDELNRHIKMHSRNQPESGQSKAENHANAVKQHYQCEFCRINFDIQSSLLYHIKRKHCIIQEIDNFKCFCCEKRLKSLSEMEKHVEQHTMIEVKKKMSERLKTNEKHFTCSFCEKTFLSEIKLKSHYVRHKITHQEHRNYLCSECGYLASYEGGLDMHMNMHTKSVKFPCEFCDTVVHYKYAIKKHRMVQHYTEIQENGKYQCALCNKLFDDVAGMVNHTNVHKEQKSTSEIRKELERLGKIYKKKRDFKHKCNICTKAFNRRSSLTSHLQMHQNMRNFVCRVCDYKLNSKDGLYQHMREVHRKKNSYPCMMCSIQFSTMQEWEEHKSTVHSKTRT